MDKIKHCFGKFELELVFYPVDKKSICCTIQNPFVDHKHEKTFQDKTQDKIIRKIDRQMKDWRKEFFKED